MYLAQNSGIMERRIRQRYGFLHLYRKLDSALTVSESGLAALAAFVPLALAVVDDRPLPGS